MWDVTANIASSITAETAFYDKDVCANPISVLKLAKMNEIQPRQANPNLLTIYCFVTLEYHGGVLTQ